jgi:regulator of protease activity HflC (stomatin/prohibitin superfamily)
MVKQSLSFALIVFSLFVMMPATAAMERLLEHHNPKTIDTLTWRNLGASPAPDLEQWHGEKIWLEFWDNPKTLASDYKKLLRLRSLLKEYGILVYGVLVYDGPLPKSLKIPEGPVPVGLDQFGVFSLMFKIRAHPTTVYIESIKPIDSADDFEETDFIIFTAPPKHALALFLLRGHDPEFPERSELSLLLSLILQWMQDHPLESGLVIMAFLRLLAVKIETGWIGVLFSFGRVRRILAPGVTPLIPWVWQVKKVRMRSITLDIAAQKVTSLEGMVYKVDANLVYRVDDPVKALVEIASLKAGCETALAMSVQELISSCNRQQLHRQEDLDELLTRHVAKRLKAWGVITEKAGFTSIAPDSQTLILSQLRVKTRERKEVSRYYVEQGLPLALAMELLGADKAVLSRSSLRYRTATRRSKAARRFQVRLDKAEAAKTGGDK